MFKRIYTREELEELRSWYERHENELPVSLQLNEATLFKDLKVAVKAFLEVYRTHGTNPTFSGQYYLLFLIRQQLESMGIRD